MATMLAGDAAAQRRTPIEVEIDAIGGFTLVSLDGWVRPGRASGGDRQLFGVMGRAFLLYIGDARLGLEGGRQRLFRYEVTESGTERRATVEPSYGGLVVRLPEQGKFGIDVGFGFYSFRERSLAFDDDGLRVATQIGVSWRILRWRGVTIPLGVRVGSIQDDRTAILPAGMTVGLSFRP
jgi:hypothetical protein